MCVSSRMLNPTISSIIMAWVYPVASAFVLRLWCGYLQVSLGCFPFSHGTGTLQCLQKEMATYRHWSVSLWRDPDDVSLSNPAPWQNWKAAAYLGYTLRMKTLFRGWPVMVNDTHIREEEDWGRQGVNLPFSSLPRRGLRAHPPISILYHTLFMFNISWTALLLSLF